MKGTLVFNISMDRKSNVSTDTDTSLGIAWDGFDIAPIKTYECDPDCVHHFIIPTSGKDIVTGQCKKCDGRREFRNTFDSVLNHHDPAIDRELAISALQGIREDELEEHYVKPLNDMVSLNPSPA